MKKSKQLLLLAVFMVIACRVQAQNEVPWRMNTNLGIVTDGGQMAFNLGLEVPVTKRVHFTPSYSWLGFGNHSIFHLDIRYYFTRKTVQWFIIFGPMLSCSNGCNVSDLPLVGTGFNIRLTDKVQFTIQGKVWPDLFNLSAVAQAGVSFSLRRKESN